MVGAIVTALLFEAGNLLIGMYLRSSAITSTYGAAGGLIALLLWIYYSAQIFLFGAEFTKAYRDARGASGIAADLIPSPETGKKSRSQSSPAKGPATRPGCQ